MKSTKAAVKSSSSSSSSSSEANSRYRDHAVVPVVKEWYWVPHPSKVWVMVLVKRVAGDCCWVTTGESITEFELNFKECPFLTLNPRVVSDMASLLHLHEAGILHNLCERANPQNQHPYTYVSTVLIAVNPLRPVPMPPMEDYRSTPLGASPPNPYGIAELAYQQLTAKHNSNSGGIVRRNQSIVISGESGAGKTETAKIALRYLCWRATADQTQRQGQGADRRDHRTATTDEGHDRFEYRRATTDEGERGRGGENRQSRISRKQRNSNARISSREAYAGAVSLDKKLLDTNPILEAFGNAKTFRNPNSSRFGKLLKLNFDSVLNFSLVSASIDTYLLEKSRVALSPAGERNYHVFYQLLRGAGAQDRKKWHLKDVDYYKYLNYGEAGDIEDVDDKIDFGKLSSSLVSVGISVAQQDFIFRVLSAVLYLGNVTFNAVESSAGETAEVRESRITERAAELLGVKVQNLEAILLTRNLDMSATAGRNSNYRIPLDARHAEYARDAIAKSMYDTIFHWLVDRIRQSLCPEEATRTASVPTASSLYYIGVLDIFGFESFEKNGLEQLLINYANESLQLLFNKSVLDAEQDMYVEEGFMIDPIEYVNNNECVNLIAMGRDAILTTLDSVCKAPEPSEEKFNNLIHKFHVKNTHFLKPEMKHLKTSFKIRHYAQVVQYTVGTFIPKNMDSCPAELFDLMSSSTHSPSCSLFSFDMGALEASLGLVEEQPALTAASKRGSTPIQSSDELNLDRNGGGALKRSTMPPKSKRQNYTVGKKFKIQMTSLADILNSTNCTFVRCIKPNSSMTPGLFDHRFVMDQVRSLGIVQTCEVLRQGLPSRVQFSEVEAIFRPHFTGVNSSLTSKLTPKKFTEAVLWAMKISKGAYKLGKSRVFFNVQSLNDMIRLLDAHNDPAELKDVVKRVAHFIIFQRWRRAFVACRTFSVVLRLLRTCRVKSRACRIIQRRWKAYTISNLRARRLRVRKLWKLSIYYTLGCQLFLSSYRLICSARDVRLRAEAEAERLLEERRAEEERQQQKIDAMAKQQGIDTATATRSCAKLFRSSSLRLKHGDSFVPNEDEMSENREIFKENKELESALMEQQRNQSKSEMRKLAAASSLATVSVILFRWTKIKKFRAFEKWYAVHKTMEGKGSTTRRSASHHSELVGQNTHNEVEKVTIESLTLPDGTYLCYECKDRVSKVWCHDCNQPYCLVCSQFVHNSCSFMRHHRPLDIENRPSLDNIKALSTPLEPLSSFVAAGTMKAMVSAILHSESNLQNKNSSISKMLYYSEASRVLDLQGIGNHASVLLDRVHSENLSDDENEEESEEPKKETQIVFSSSGGIAHADDEAQHCAIRSCNVNASMGISIRFCTAHYEEFRSATRSLHDGSDDSSNNSQETATLQQQVALLKRQLIDSGQQPVEFVELSVARALMQAAVERLMSGDEKAEGEIEKWDKAIRLNPEYQKEMLERARKWEEDELPSNLSCMQQMRRIIPFDVRKISAAKMEEQGLPKKVAQRIYSKKILWFICTHPEDIGKIHIADLRTKYSFVGLDIIEMRAVYASLPLEFENDGDGKKKEWRDNFRQKLEEFTIKEKNNRLTGPEKRNVAYKGSETLSIYDPDVPILRAELLKSDAFGPTDISDIAALTGTGGVKDKKNKMLKSTTDDVIIRDSGIDDNKDENAKEGTREIQDPSTSSLIADSIAAAKKEKRAAARGSFISPMTNPLVQQDALSDVNRASIANSSAFTGGISSIQKTIQKMEAAKMQKDHKATTEVDSQDESKKVFASQYQVSKGIRPPNSAGRGRGRLVKKKSQSIIVENTSSLGVAASVPKRSSIHAQASQKWSFDEVYSDSFSGFSSFDNRSTTVGDLNDNVEVNKVLGDLLHDKCKIDEDKSVVHSKSEVIQETKVEDNSLARSRSSNSLARSRTSKTDSQKTLTETNSISSVIPPSSQKDPITVKNEAITQKSIIKGSDTTTRDSMSVSSRKNSTGTVNGIVRSSSRQVVVEKSLISNGTVSSQLNENTLQEVSDKSAAVIIESDHDDDIVLRDALFSSVDKEIFTPGIQKDNSDSKPSVEKIVHADDDEFSEIVIVRKDKNNISKKKPGLWGLLKKK